MFPCKWWKSISFKIFSCFLFYRISHHFYLLISSVKLTLSSISNSLSFWTVNLITISSNFSLNYLARHLTNKHKIYLYFIVYIIKLYNTSDSCWYWSSTKLHWTKTTLTTSRLGGFSPFFIFSINFSVLSNNFIFVILFNIHLSF